MSTRAHAHEETARRSAARSGRRFTASLAAPRDPHGRRPRRPLRPRHRRGDQPQRRLPVGPLDRVRRRHRLGARRRAASPSRSSTYILNRGEYHPLVRPALLAALFGYVQAALSVFVRHRALLERVAHVLAEVRADRTRSSSRSRSASAATPSCSRSSSRPMVLERLRLEGRCARGSSRVLFFFVALGVLLPTMHQSSLGSLLVVFGPQVEPALPDAGSCRCSSWSRAIGMGLAAVVLEGTVSSVALRRPLEREILGQADAHRRSVLTASSWSCASATSSSAACCRSRSSRRRSPIVFWIETRALRRAADPPGADRRGADPQRLFLAAMSMALAGIAVPASTPTSSRTTPAPAGTTSRRWASSRSPSASSPSRSSAFIIASAPAGPPEPADAASPPHET